MQRISSVVVAVALVAAATLLGVSPPAAAESTTHTITVEDFRFLPETVYVSPGDTVQWKRLNGAHTVTASDGSFNRPIDAANPSFTHTFEQLGTFEYGCTIHTNMSGEVVVEPADTFTGDVLYVPSDAPTLRRAVEIVRSGATIVLEDRVPVVTIDGEIDITKPGLTIRSGSKARKQASSGVKLVPTNAPIDYAFDVHASDVTIRGLTIENFARAGINVGPDARIAQLRDLVLRNNRDAGIQSTGNVAIADVVASGSRRAGVSLRDCDDCGRVERLTATDNFVGLEVVNGAGVTVADSRFERNANGIAMASTLDTPAPSSGAWLTGNTIVDNQNADAPRPSIFEDDVHSAAGAGLWIGGGQWVTATDNTIDGHRWGVAATALGVNPATNNRISANRVGNSELADLAWDGVGTGTCFSGNAFTGASLPPAIETAYPCAGVVPTVGVPLPVAQADLALHALTTYYAEELGLSEEVTVG